MGAKRASMGLSGIFVGLPRSRQSCSIVPMHQRALLRDARIGAYPGGLHVRRRCIDLGSDALDTRIARLDRLNQPGFIDQLEDILGATDSSQERGGYYWR